MAALFKRSDLVDKMAKSMNVNKQRAEDITSVFFGFMKEAIVDNGLEFRIPILGGTLKKVIVPARKSRNPRTGELKDIPEKWKIKYTFKPQKIEEETVIAEIPAPTEAQESTPEA